MSWEGTDPRIYQALKKFKVLLDRVTPNKSAEAEIMGLRPSTITGWCTPTQNNPNLPAALLPLHSEGVKLLDILARQVGHTLIPIARPAEMNGDVRDEVMACTDELGTIAGQVRAALRDMVSPDKIDTKEANTILDQARDLQKAVHLLVSELSDIANQEGE